MIAVSAFTTRLGGLIWTPFVDHSDPCEQQRLLLQLQRLLLHHFVLLPERLLQVLSTPKPIAFQALCRGQENEITFVTISKSTLEWM
ncbi:hypothetical protein FA13DRAFT_1786997 [Coprinellus micaceus]|uniref:Uncharacterized protein n=1 Tax=Coprinellus micaceus TaxID=71717 RepID=A0A4Y7TSP6_COPMI|nr:hypothetical protein FA13DRAFT_1786997 [Coprinellus micaceus]